METNNKKEQVLEKIRKLLALADDAGASEGEVENALKMAQRLMIKHQIEEDEIKISIDDIGEEFVEQNWVAGERKYFAWDVLCVIGKRYSVQVIKKGSVANFRYRVIGDRTSRKITIDTFQKLMPFIRALAKQRYKEYESKSADLSSLSPLLRMLAGDFGVSEKVTWKKFLPNYMAGYLQGLDERLQKDLENENISDEEKSKWSLIVVKKDDLVEQYIQDTTKDLKSQKSTTAKNVDEITRVGHQDGKEQNATERLH
jgi:hypothetical protein